MTSHTLNAEALEKAREAAERACNYEWRGRPYMEVQEVENWQEIVAAAVSAYLTASRRAASEGEWQPMETLEHSHVDDAPCVLDGKAVPAMYSSDVVLLTNGTRVWAERSIIMGGALSSSADKFTAYPSGDKPIYWMPLPNPPFGKREDAPSHGPFMDGDK